MNAPAAATMIEGPLGSTFHVLRADAETVAALAAVDWNRHFRRVSLDPVRGLVTVMLPSFLHDNLAEILRDVVSIASDTLRQPVTRTGTTRLRRRGDPPNTGLEPDCAFYLRERAERFLAAVAEGMDAADAFIEEIWPDLVVEVEVTSADEGKAERYAEMQVRELWRLHGRKGTKKLRAEFLALRPGRPPRGLAASEALGGLTPDDVCEAVEPVRMSPSRAAQTEAVDRIVRRRQRGSLRVREEAATYSASPVERIADPAHQPS